MGAGGEAAKMHHSSFSTDTKDPIYDVYISTLSFFSANVFS